jgi:hypothetical protein
MDATPSKKGATGRVLVTEDMIELRSLYIGYLRNEIGSFKSLLARKDLDQIKELGHRLKGSGGTYGFHRISELGETIQYLETDVDWKDVEGLLLQLIELYDQIRISQGDN